MNPAPLPDDDLSIEPPPPDDETSGEAPSTTARGRRELVRAIVRKVRLPKGSIVLAMFTAVSVGLGYAREVTYAYYFGTSAALDTFLVAFTLPMAVVTLTTTVSVSALLPEYVGRLRGSKPTEARLLIRRWLSLILVTLTVVAVVLALAPGPTIALLAPGFDAAQTADAARLLRGLLPYMILAGAAAVYKLVLDSHQRFTAPALARGLVTAVVIGTVILTSSRFGVWALAVGYVIGGGLMLGLHVVGTRGIESRPRLRDLRWPATAGLPLAGVGWVLAQMTVGQLQSIADRFFASGLDAGSIAALNYARATVTAPQTFVTSVLATALFPILARKVARGRTDAALHETRKWILVVWAATAPLIIAFIAFRTEIVALLFERGAFDEASTGLVASVLAILPISIAVGGSNAIVNRLLLSRRAYRFTASTAVITTTSKIGMNALMVGPLGVAGLALASVLSGVLGLVIRLVYAWRVPPSEPSPPL